MIEKARARIKAQLDRPGMTKVLLADRAGVHRNTLNGYEDEGWNPNAQTLEAIMRVVEKLEKV